MQLLEVILAQIFVITDKLFKEMIYYQILVEIALDKRRQLMSVMSLSGGKV